MNKIILVTTEGCEGCKIMNNIIRDAIGDVNKDITFETLAVKNANRLFLKLYKITDFPTILLFKDDTNVFKWCGTVPKTVVNRWINIYF